MIWPGVYSHDSPLATPPSLSLNITRTIFKSAAAQRLVRQNAATSVRNITNSLLPNEWFRCCAEVASGMGSSDLLDLIGRPNSDDFSASGAALRPEIDHPIGRTDH